MPIQVYTHDDILALKFPDKDLIGSGLLPPQGRLLMAGAHKVGKTILAVQLACDLATGSKFLDRFDIPVPVHVLIVEAEVGLRGFKQRWRKTSKCYDRTLIRENIRIIDETELDIENIEFLDLIYNLGFKPQVIILDPFYLVQKRGEDKTTEIKPILKLLNHIIKQTGAAIVLVHHIRKPSITIPDLNNGNGNGHYSPVSYEIRGSSSLPAWSDTNLVAGHISESQDRVITYFEGRSIEEIIDPLIIVLDRNELRFHPITGITGTAQSKIHDTIISCLLKSGGSVNQNTLIKTIEENSDKKYQYIWREVSQLVTSNVLKKHPDDSISFPWRLAVKHEAFNKYIGDEDDEDED